MKSDSEGSIQARRGQQRRNSNSNHNNATQGINI